MSQLTDGERAAIKHLEQLAERWPSSLLLFSWSGELCVIREDDGEVVATISGIPNDGGDPQNEIIDGISYLKR